MAKPDPWCLSRGEARELALGESALGWPEYPGPVLTPVVPASPSLGAGLFTGPTSPRSQAYQCEFWKLIPTKKECRRPSAQCLHCHEAPISAKYAEADRSIHRYSIFGLDRETLKVQQLTRLTGSGPPLRRRLGALPPPQKACSFGASCEDHRMRKRVEESSIAPVPQAGHLDHLTARSSKPPPH
jgi:hypothetical protein